MSSDNVLEDVWGSDNDSPHEIISYDLNKLRDNHNKRGYLDGITHSREANLQSGFDEGFPAGAKLGMEVGKLVGLLQGLANKYGDQDKSLLEDFNTIQEDLRINKVLTKTHFDANLNLQGEHSLIVKWNAIVKTYSEKYSIHTGL